MLDRATGSALVLSSTLQSLKGPDALAQHPEQGSVWSRGAATVSHRYQARKHKHNDDLPQARRG